MGRLTVAISVQSFRTLRMRLPDVLLQNSLRENHIEALTSYVPVKYPGRIILFRAAESLAENPVDSPLCWAPLAGDGLDVYHFDASHELMRPEYAHEVAARLDECLSRAYMTDQRSAQ